MKQQGRGGSGSFQQVVCNGTLGDKVRSRLTTQCSCQRFDATIQAFATLQYCLVDPDGREFDANFKFADGNDALHITDLQGHPRIAHVEGLFNQPHVYVLPSQTRMFIVS